MPIARQPRAVVTGAGSGLGRAFCVRLAARGARILAADIDLESARATVALLGTAEARAVRADVSQLADVEALAGEAERGFGGVDLVVNNAGIAVSGLVGELPIEAWRAIVGVNLWGVVHGCHVFTPRLRAQGSGHILNVASAAGLLSVPLASGYCATKAAVVALSETLCIELAGSGVGCTVLCPTFFPTNIARAASTMDERMRRRVERMMARSRLSAEDVAEYALNTCDRGALYSLPHADGRWLWRVKRAMPERYHKLAPRVTARATAKLDRD